MNAGRRSSALFTDEIRCSLSLLFNCSMGELVGGISQIRLPLIALESYRLASPSFPSSSGRRNWKPAVSAAIYVDLTLFGCGRLRN